MQVYLYVNEQQVGPYTIDQLQQLIAAGQIPAETPAWYEGLSEWSTVASVLENASVHLLTPVLPPPPVVAVAPETPPDVNCRNKRVLGGIVDLCVLPIIILPLLLVIELLRPQFFGDGHGESMFGWLLCAPVVAYFLSSSFQATPGMMLCGLILTNVQGQRIGFGRALVRHLVSIFSLGFLLIGYLLWNFNKKRQTLHDMAAGTIVVTKPSDFKRAVSPWIPLAAMIVPSILLSIGLFAFTNVGASLSDQTSDKDSSSQPSQQTATATTPDPTQSNPTAAPVPASAPTPAPAPTTDNTTQAGQAPDASQASDEDTINEVKGGTLDFDNTVKIGPALEGSSFLKNVTWKSFQTAQGRQVVEATGMVNFEAYKNTNLDDSGTKLPANWVDTALKNAPSLKISYTVQFQLSQADEKTISVGYSGYTMTGQNADTGKPSQGEIKDDDEFKILKSIFANQPDLQISGLLAGLSQQTQATPPTSSAPANQPSQ